MNEQVDKDMNTATTDDSRFRRHRVLSGLFILAIGVVWLMRESGVQFPGWFFTWPVLLIAIGILGAIKSHFRPGGWIAILVVGGVFFIDHIYPGTSFKHYAWPL